MWALNVSFSALYFVFDLFSYLWFTSTTLILRHKNWASFSFSFEKSPGSTVFCKPNPHGQGLNSHLRKYLCYTTLKSQLLEISRGKSWFLCLKSCLMDLSWFNLTKKSPENSRASVIRYFRLVFFLLLFILASILNRFKLVS